jgi:hypothetical protein
MNEEDAQTAALQEYFDGNTPAGYGAAFRAGWDAGKRWGATEVPGWTTLIDERDRLNRLVDTLSRALMRYQDAGAASDPHRPCQCGREVFMSRDGTRRCPGCEYMEAETCDCVPV